MKKYIEEHSSMPSQLAIASSIILTLIYLCIGFGISGLTIIVGIKSLLLGFLIIILPILLQRIFKTTSWYLSHGVIDLISLAILILLGVVSRLFTIDLSTVIAISGFLLFVWFIFFEPNSFFKKKYIAQLALFSLAIALIGIIVIGKNFYIYDASASPIYSSLGVDTYFHTAISAMIKIHGIPSTGLDGVPYINYHWGNHFIFAFLSQLINIKTIDFYIAAYPIIFIPFYFNSVFIFIINLRKHKHIPIKFSVFFFVLMLIAYIGGLYEIFLSESFLISMSFFFLLIVTILAFIEAEQKKIKKIKSSLFYYIVLPILISLIILTKLSNVFFIIGVFIYLFVRYKLFKKTTYTLSFILCLIATLIIIILTMYKGLTSPANIRYELFYLQYLKTFFYVYHVWAIIFIYFYLKSNNISTFSDIKDAIKNRKIMELEILIIAIILGLIPGFFLNFYNTLGYFIVSQQWPSLTLLLTFLPIFTKNNIRSYLISFSRWKIVPTVIVLVIILTNSSRIFYNILVINTYLTNNAKLNSITNKNSSSSNLSENQLFIKIKEINNLSLSEKEKTIIYIPKSNNIFWDKKFLNRVDPDKVDFERSFIIPALTEIPLIYGLSSISDTRYYGLSSYKKESIISPNITLDEVIKRARSKGFLQIIIIKYDGKNFNIEKQKVL